MSHECLAKKDDGLTTLERSLTPRQRLAYLLARHMSIDVDPDELAEFIKQNWRKVQVCAHTIHDEPNSYQPNSQGTDHGR